VLSKWSSVIVGSIVERIKCIEICLVYFEKKQTRANNDVMLPISNMHVTFHAHVAKLASDPISVDILSLPLPFGGPAVCLYDISGGRKKKTSSKTD
jgi:hypothetical protein